ncbi:MAG: O-methyltransferase [Saprospiraceae bacterium]
MIPTDFLQDALQRYCEQHSEALPYYLTEIERRTHRTTLAPQMISGHLQGRLLSLLSRLRRPRCIVEIGTFTGYSAVCLSEGLSSEGILHTIDIDDQYQPFYDYIREQVPKSHQIKFHSGDALEIIPQLQGPFDLVFIDGAKKDYLRYFEIITERCSPGCLLISDNVLWSGKVLDAQADKDTSVLKEYNQMLLHHKDWNVTIIPFRDGISVAVKVN